MWRRSEMATPDAPSAARIDFAHALRESAVTGLIAFGLFLPLIGFNTVQTSHNELILQTRWPLLAALVAIVAGGRFLQALVIAPWLARRAMKPKPVERAAWRSALARWLGPFTLGFAIIYPALVLSLVGFQGAPKWI